MRTWDEAATQVISCCSHHQAVDRVGEGLVVTARSDDGIVEALEAASPERGWLLSVQWHPEKVAATEQDHQAIFDAFVAASSQVRARVRSTHA